MPSTYSALKLQLMATGENNAAWGDVTNTNLGTALEEAIAGSADVTFASANVTLTLIDTNTTQTARNMRLRCTGTTGGARNLVVPAIEKAYIVRNDCADIITVKNATGTGVAVPAGGTLWVFNDGANVVAAINYLPLVTLGTALPISSGGTGATDAATARANIGAGTVTSVAGAGTVNGISLTGTVTTSGSLTLGGTLSGVSLATQVTGTLPIANGGTAATTAAAALTALGAYPAANPSGYTTNTGTATSVSGTGTVNGISLSGTVTTSGSLTLGGTLSGISLTTQVTGTLPIANGGTGASDAATAQTNLNVPSRTGASASGTWGINISGNATTATTATTANALNTGNTYTAVGYVSTQTSGTALQVGDNSGIRNFSTTGQAVYIDVAGGGATAGQIILRNTNAFTAMAVFNGSGTQLTSLGVGTAPSGTAGEIRATNNVTAFFSSDARLKENIAPIEGALDKACAIGGKTFDWTDAYIAARGGEDGYFVRKSDFGVIAQDVQSVFPLAVRERDDRSLAVDYEKLCALAFQAIKELREKVEALS